jgi:hypothetical protein
VKPCDNLKVKNALVKSAYYVDVYIIFKLVTDGWTEALPYLSTLVHSNTTTLSLQSDFSCCFVVARLPTGYITMTVRRHFSHNGGRYFIWQLSVARPFRHSLITLSLTYGARPPPTRSAKRRHEVTNDTCQISCGFCKKNIHLKFSIIWQTKQFHFLLKSVEMRMWRALACSLTYLLTYSLTPQGRNILEKLTGSQLVKKFPTFYGTRKFITAFTSARQLSPFWAISIQSMPSHPTSWRSILILSYHLRLSLPSGWTLSFRFPHQDPENTSLPYMLHAPPISFCSI